MKKSRQFLIVSVLLNASAFNAFAQEAKPVAATNTANAATPAANIPKHTCTKPELQGRLASDRQMKQFNKEVDSYRDCLVSYEKAMRATALQYRDVANAAVDEYNEFVKLANPSK